LFDDHLRTHVRHPIETKKSFDDYWIYCRAIAAPPYLLIIASLFEHQNFSFQIR